MQDPGAGQHITGAVRNLHSPPVAARQFRILVPELFDHRGQVEVAERLPPLETRAAGRRLEPFRAARRTPGGAAEHAVA